MFKDCVCKRQLLKETNQKQMGGVLDECVCVCVCVYLCVHLFVFVFECVSV